jgi:hypothetical protein
VSSLSFETLPVVWIQSLGSYRTLAPAEYGGEVDSLNGEALMTATDCSRLSGDTDAAKIGNLSHFVVQFYLLPINCNINVTQSALHTHIHCIHS